MRAGPGLCDQSGCRIVIAILIGAADRQTKINYPRADFWLSLAAGDALVKLVYDRDDGSWGSEWLATAERR
jgi:hypothetical protein